MHWEAAQKWTEIARVLFPSHHTPQVTQVEPYRPCDHQTLPTQQTTKNTQRPQLRLVRKKALANSVDPDETPHDAATHQVNVESCTQTKLVITTYDAADNGLVYIQGQGDACKRVTSSGIAFYEFDFEECGITW
ncbi:hypothetical protein DPMN_155538, partial [Dreissena polymorpha]